jgi:hypothetical protein
MSENLLLGMLSSQNKSFWQSLKFYCWHASWSAHVQKSNELWQIGTKSTRKLGGSRNKTPSWGTSWRCTPWPNYKKSSRWGWWRRMRIEYGTALARARTHVACRQRVKKHYECMNARLSRESFLIIEALCSYYCRLHCVIALLFKSHTHISQSVSHFLFLISLSRSFAAWEIP